MAELLLRPRGGRVSSAAIGDAYRSLAIQLDAGIDIRRGVRTLATHHSGTALGVALSSVARQLEAGEPLSVAIAEHAETFGQADVRAIDASERAGVLEETLNRLADMREATARLRKSAVTALAYPAMIVLIALAITLLLFAFVVPTIVAPIVEEGVALPLPTRIVMAISWLVTRGWWLIALVVVGGSFGLRRLLRTEAGKRRFDGLVLRVPVVGPMLEKHALAQAATLLGTCVRCGLNLVESLDLASHASRNRVVGDRLSDWRDGVRDGQDVGDALRGSGRYPMPMADLVEVGVATGQLDATLGKLAERFEDDVDETARRLGALVEPMLVVFLGVVVLLIALAVLLPILQLGRVFG
ncbi:MAG: type II secretion system F family protein [Planctomycetota bacterium]